MRDYPVKPENPRHCYICAATGVKMTRDHVPPKGFFLPEERDNLLTVRMCEACHKPLSEIDNRMRTWFSDAINVNEAGRWIRQNPVERGLASDKRLREERENRIRLANLFSPEGEQYRYCGEEQACIFPFIRRMTKACLYRFAPKYDYFPDYFYVARYTPAKMREILPLMKKHTKGKGVFEVWGGIAENFHTAGLWGFRFYESTFFVCTHGKDPKYKQKFGPGYKEDPSLPKYL